MLVPPLRKLPPLAMIETLPYMIRFIREARGLSQAAAAEKVSWKRTYFNKLERRSCTPTITNFMLLCHALDVTPYELLRLCETAAAYQ